MLAVASEGPTATSVLTGGPTFSCSNPNPWPGCLNEISDRKLALQTNCFSNNFSLSFNLSDFEETSKFYYM